MAPILLLVLIPFLWKKTCQCKFTLEYYLVSWDLLIFYSWLSAKKNLLLNPYSVRPNTGPAEDKRRKFVITFLQKFITQLEKKQDIIILKRDLWSSLCGSVVTNLTSIPTDVSSIPPHDQWVRDPAFL